MFAPASLIIIKINCKNKQNSNTEQHKHKLEARLALNSHLRGIRQRGSVYISIDICFRSIAAVSSTEVSSNYARNLI